MDLLSSRQSQTLWAHNLWRMFCAGFRHSAGFHARVIGLREVDYVMVVLCVDPVESCSACADVVVVRRVNKENNVLVVRGKCESNKG